MMSICAKKVGELVAVWYKDRCGLVKFSQVFFLSKENTH